MSLHPQLLGEYSSHSFRFTNKDAYVWKNLYSPWYDNKFKFFLDVIPEEKPAISKGKRLTSLSLIENTR